MGEQHVLMLFLLVSVFFVFRAESYFSVKELIPVFLFIILQFLLFFSWLLDINNNVASFWDVPSMLRPLALLIFYLGFLSFIKSGCSIDFFGNFVFLVSVILFAIFIFSRSFENYDQIVSAVYFNNDKFRDNAFLSVFGSTYFAAYFYYIVFLYSICRIVIFTPNIKWVFVFVVSLIFLYFSQSKSAYFSALMSIFIVLFLSFGIVVRIFLILLVSVSGLLLFYFKDDLIGLLATASQFSLRQIYLLLTIGYEFESVSNRVDQIVYSFNGSLDNYLLGIGLGRGVLLESYLASYTYRYGLFGFLLYNAFYFSVSIYALVLFNKEKYLQSKVIYLFVSVWFVNIPVLMISNPMFEMGKNAIFSMLILAVFFSSASLSRNTLRWRYGLNGYSV